MLRTTALCLALAPLALGCSNRVGSSTDDVVDVQHTPVERQSIGNCWLYAEASWVESMHLAATGETFDTSQSYWTYWHWFDQIASGQAGDHIETGGWFGVAGSIVKFRGLMAGNKFVPEDATSEMSLRQSDAESKIDQELKSGRLADPASRQDRALVRKVMEDAWSLNPDVRAELVAVFGDQYDKSLTGSANPSGSDVLRPADFKVWYTERKDGAAVDRNTTLDVAIASWQEASYPTWDSKSIAADRRDFQIRVQRALHDRQPVVMVWDVDFNAMESSDEALRGSFNLTTLKNAGRPGRQGGHMTVLEDYEVTTEQYGVLKAGVTLDPHKPEDKAKLDAALLPASTIRFLRIKNSWGAFRDDRSSAPGFPGYHDLYQTYLDGPIAWCPDLAEPKDSVQCMGIVAPWSGVVLPPGY